jgi:hypothetical protein
MAVSRRPGVSNAPITVTKSISYNRLAQIGQFGNTELKKPPELPSEWLSLFTHSGAPGEIRTPDLLIRSQTLYPSELRAHKRCEVIISLDTLAGLVNFVRNKDFTADGGEDTEKKSDNWSCLRQPVQLRRSPSPGSSDLSRNHVGIF